MDDLETPSSTKAPVKAVDRVALWKEESEKVSAWLKQLEESSSGFLQLSRSDVVNFLISEHKTELSSREMQQIRTRHYDPIRHLNWITPRLKEALQNDDLVTVNALQNEIKSIELSVISKAKKLSGVNDGGEPTLPKPRKRRAKKSDLTNSVGESSFAESQTELPEG